MKKYTKHCPRCGSERIRLITGLYWDVYTQHWVPSSTARYHGHVLCASCDHTSKVSDVVTRRVHWQAEEDAA